MRTIDIPLQKENNYNQYQNIVTAGMQIKQEKVTASEETDNEQDDYTDRQTDSDGDAVLISEQARELFAENGNEKNGSNIVTVEGASIDDGFRQNFNVEINKGNESDNAEEKFGAFNIDNTGIDQGFSGAISKDELPESATEKVSTTIQGTGQFARSASGQDVLAHTVQKGFNPFEY